MITIDLANKRLMKIYVTELTETETKILSLLSDNRFHKIDEIADFIHYADAYKVVNKLIEKYNFLLNFENKRNVGYRVTDKILIK